MRNKNEDKGLKTKKNIYLSLVVCFEAWGPESDSRRNVIKKNDEKCG